MKKSPRAKIHNRLPVAAVFGKNIENLRINENSKRYVFSKHIHYDRNRLAELEDGMQDIHLSTAIRIAKSVNISLEFLFDPSFRDEFDSCRLEQFKDVDYLSVFISNVTKKLSTLNLKKTTAFRNREKAFRILSKRVTDPMISSLSEMAEDLNTPLSELLRK